MFSVHLHLPIYQSTSEWLTCKNVSYISQPYHYSHSLFQSMFTQPTVMNPNMCIAQEDTIVSGNLNHNGHAMHVVLDDLLKLTLKPI